MYCTNMYVFSMNKMLFNQRDIGCHTCTNNCSGLLAFAVCNHQVKILYASKKKKKDGSGYNSENISIYFHEKSLLVHPIRTP